MTGRTYSGRTSSSVSITVFMSTKKLRKALMLATLHPLWNTIEIPWEYGGSSSGNAVGKLVKVNSIMNKKVYHNILVHHGFLSGLKPIGHGFAPHILWNLAVTIWPRRRNLEKWNWWSVQNWILLNRFGGFKERCNEKIHPGQVSGNSWKLFEIQ